MTHRLTSARLLLLAVAIACAATTVHAQIVHVEMDEWGNPALRIGQDYSIKQGETAREAIVIAGDATIEGHVTQDVVVVLGKVQLASTADIGGSLITVGGTVTAADGAQVHRDIVVVGGLEASSTFRSGGQQIVVGTAGLGNWMRGLVPWLTHGLMWGRPIVPGLPWVWAVAAVFFLINLLFNVVFDAPVSATAATLRATPLSAFMTGLLVLLLIGPICVLLAVSVIGIAVIPFVLCALLLAALLGRIGVARWIGMSVVTQEDGDHRAQSMRSFLIGSAIICIAYMIPILGFVTWTIVGVFGLGASTLAFFSAYRRENPKPPRPEPVVAAAPMVPPAEAPPGSFGTGPAPAPLAFEALDDARVMPAAPAAAIASTFGLLAFPRAAFKDRLAAFALDFILVTIVAQVLGSDSRNDDVFMRLLLIVSLAYHVGFWTWKGTTLGGIICNLRLVRTDGAPLKFAEALVRGLTGIFSLLVLGLGFFWILRDPERQAWHDRVAGTYVVKVPRAYPI